MFTSASPASVAELAQLLIARKREGKRTLLFLGSRTGGFFGNQAFYNGLQGFSLRDFSKLSEIEKFDECYQILKNLVDEYNAQDLGVKELLEDLLANWLTEAARREEDNYMAELVKEGFFDIIISTNIDSLLEDAFGRQEMKNPEDYEIVNMLDGIVDVERIKAGMHTMIKVFGKLEHGSSVAITGEISPDVSQQLMTLLNATSERDVLAIGYNPLWDRQVEQVLITKGELWYINEELPEHDANILRVLSGKNRKYISGLYYRRFVQELYQNIREHDAKFIEQNRSDTKGPTIELLDDSKRRKVFISYSHKDDKRHLEILQKYLSVIVGNESIYIWSDTRLRGGEDWHAEIQEALATTKVAILFVSINFLTSEYIDKYELPPLLEATNAGEVTLVPVLLSACPTSKSKLHRYQFINHTVPLNKMSQANREALWTRVAYRVDELLFPERQ